MEVIRETAGGQLTRGVLMRGQVKRRALTPRFRHERKGVPDGERELLSSPWMSLADWHRQLAAGPESRRLNLWQLEYYGTQAPLSARSHSSRAQSRCEASRPPSSARGANGSVCVLSPETPSILAPAQPYPELPKSVIRDNASSRSGRRPVFNGRCPSSDCPSSGTDEMPPSPAVPHAVSAIAEAICVGRPPRPSPEPRPIFASHSTQKGMENRTCSAWTSLSSDFRRIEVTVRGVFRVEDLEDDELPKPSAEAQVEPRDVEERSEVSDETWARMGFGRGEQGATPSGRSSVPAVRSAEGKSEGALPGLGADEGIELELLTDAVLKHFRRVLLRFCVQGPSAGDEEPSPGSQVQARASRSCCPSPPPMPENELALSVALRLCRSRCGSSSAVLELSLGHSSDCSASGCRCFPTPEIAEAMLLANLARHSTLRLMLRWPLVKMTLEPLSD